MNLRDELRSGISDEALRTMLAATWRTRSDRCSELRGGLPSDAPSRRRLEMHPIGG